jgi:hypothetical protein
VLSPQTTHQYLSPYSGFSNFDERREEEVMPIDKYSLKYSENSLSNSSDNLAANRWEISLMNLIRRELGGRAISV